METLNAGPRQFLPCTLVLKWPVSTTASSILLSIVFLLWPALLNGYPLIFSDTGTYISQAIRHYLGWDRPAFYSVFLLATNWQTSLWRSVAAQSVITLYVLDLARRVFTPGMPRGLMLWIVLGLSIVTPLPWLVGQIMPDLFTGLLVICMAVLITGPEAVGRSETRALIVLAAWIISIHLSHLWIALVLAVTVGALRVVMVPEGAVKAVLRGITPIAIAVGLLCAANLLGFHKLSIAPFGKVFLFARAVYDGPGMETLKSDCPKEHWKVCGLLGGMGPGKAWPTSDYFLWAHGGPLSQLGGGKLFAPEAAEVIRRTVEEHPVGLVWSSLHNFEKQLMTYNSGDGLRPWPNEVGRDIALYYPATEYAQFVGSVQEQKGVNVPAVMNALHSLSYWLGSALTVGLLCWSITLKKPIALLCVAVLTGMVVNAAVTGALSGPHDRYQNRVIWLAILAPMMMAGEALARSVKVVLRRHGRHGVVLMFRFLTRRESLSGL